MTIASFVALYLAGLATFASPCILPLLPLYVAILSGPATSSRTRRVLAGLGFALGLSIVFIVLGMGVSSLALALSSRRQALMIAAGVAMIGLGAQRSHAASPLLAAAELASYALGLSTPLVAAAIAAPRVLAVARRLASTTPLIQRGMGVVLIGMGLLVASDHVNLLAPTALTATVAQAPAAAAHECAITGANTCSASEHVRPDAVANIPVGRAHLLEFISPHCTVCAKTAPIVEELERECTGNDGTVVRVDVETPAGRALAERFAVHAVPTFVQLDVHGAELTRLVGEQSREGLALALGNTRGEACSLL